ncbi:MAG: hypothetical protein ACREI7_06700 [Myxococcota bacterium]
MQRELLQRGLEDLAAPVPSAPAFRLVTTASRRGKDRLHADSESVTDYGYGMRFRCWLVK